MMGTIPIPIPIPIAIWVKTPSSPGQALGHGLQHLFLKSH
jgi:hypothetical protein